MTTYTTVTLIPLTSSGSDILGNGVPAANYYGGQGYVQTLTYTQDGFQGNVTVQATLNDSVESAPWFDIDHANTATPTSATVSNSVIGNFTWLRAVVTNFSSGNITVTAAY